MRLLGNSSVCDGCDIKQLDKYLALLYKPRPTVKPVRKSAPTANQDDDDDNDDGSENEEDDGDPDCEPIEDADEDSAGTAAEDDGRKARHPTRSQFDPKASFYHWVAFPVP